MIDHTLLTKLLLLYSTYIEYVSRDSQYVRTYRTYDYVILSYCYAENRAQSCLKDYNLKKSRTENEKEEEEEEEEQKGQYARGRESVYTYVQRREELHTCNIDRDMY